MLFRSVQELVHEGLVAKDLTQCWLYRRVCPLQSRAHKTGHMSGRYDATRLTPRNFTTIALDSWLWMLTKERVDEEWQLDLPPYSRKHPPPKLGFLDLQSFTSVNLIWLTTTRPCV